MLYRILVAVLGLLVTMGSVASEDKCAKLLEPGVMQNTRPVEENNFAEVKYRLRQNIQMATSPGTHSAIMRVANRIFSFNPNYSRVSLLPAVEPTSMILGSVAESSSLFLKYLEGKEYGGWFVNIHSLNRGILSYYDGTEKENLINAIYKERHSATGRHTDTVAISVLSTLDQKRVDFNLYTPEVLSFLVNKFIVHIENGSHDFLVNSQSILNVYDHHQKAVVEGKQSYDVVVLMRQVGQILYELYPDYFLEGPVRVREMPSAH